MSKIDGEKVLAVKIEEWNQTVEECLKYILKELVKEGEGFSGKRPGYDSGWENTIAAALAEEGMLKATWYDYGDGDKEIKDFSWKDYNALIFAAIDAL